MTEYRFYFVDHTGHVSRPAVIASCSDDEIALIEAGKLLDATAIEVWHGARRVGCANELQLAEERVIDANGPVLVACKARPGCIHVPSQIHGL